MSSTQSCWKVGPPEQYPLDPEAEYTLVDGDIVAYLAAGRVGRPIDWDGNGDVDDQSTPEEAIVEADRILCDIRTKTGVGSKIVVCLSDPTGRYYRHDFFPEYKQNRTHGRKPKNLYAVKDYLRSGSRWECVWGHGLEADDCIAHLYHELFVYPIVVSNDKDMKQLSGSHYDPVKDVFSDVTDREAARNLYRQIIIGDPTDGVPGIKGIGESAFNKIWNDARPITCVGAFYGNHTRILERNTKLVTLGLRKAVERGASELCAAVKKIQEKDYADIIKQHEAIINKARLSLQRESERLGWSEPSTPAPPAANSPSPDGLRPQVGGREVWWMELEDGQGEG